MEESTPGDVRFSERQSPTELDSLTGVPFLRSTIGMLIVAEDGQTILRANDAVTALLGQRFVAGTSHARVPATRSADSHAARLQALVDGDLDQLENEITMVTGRGRVRVIGVSTRCTPRAARVFLLQLQDVTAIRRHEEVLSISESRYRQLLENLPNMSVLTFDRDLVVLIAAGGVIERTGYKPSALVGSYLGTSLPRSPSSSWRAITERRWTANPRNSITAARSTAGNTACGSGP